MVRPRQVLDPADIPQANQLPKLLDMVRAAAVGEPLGPDLAPQDRACYTHDSRLLGLLNETEQITPLGRVLVGLESEPARTAVLCEAFRQMTAVQRWMRWARVTHVRQLDPATADDFLADESDLGPSTGHRRALTLRKWWFDLCGAPERRETVRPAAPGPVLPTDLSVLEWNDLGAVITADQGAIALVRLELPARMRTFVRAEELETVGDLLAFRQEELIERPNLGRKSIEDTRQAIVAKLAELTATSTSSHGGYALDEHPDLFTLLRRRLADLPSQQRLVLTHRIGAQGRVTTFDELGALLGLTRERVRQVEREALVRLKRDDAWLRSIDDRLREKLTDGAVPLSELARDRWLIDVDARAYELRFVVERLLDGQLSLVALGDQVLLAMAKESQVLEAHQLLRTALRSAEYPLAQAAYDELVAQHTRGLPGGVIAVLAEQLARDLHRVEGPHGPELVAFGVKRASQILAYVHACSEPVPVREIEGKFGSGAVPDGLIHVGRGLVWAAERIPGFVTWQERLTPLCIALMRQEDPERQWASYELLEELAGRAQLPEWLNHFHLSSMLRESGQLIDLGRFRFRLRTEEASEARVIVRDMAIEELTKAGAPLWKAALVARIRQRGAVSDIAMFGVLSRLPFVMVEKDRWGLVERDVPGGSEAFAAGLQAVEDELRRRGAGLSRGESLAFVRAMSPNHARWTLEMVRSLARAGNVLRAGASGAIGLWEWNDVRVPSPGAVVRELVDAEEGRASLHDVRRKLAELHGVHATDGQIANLAVTVDARVRAGYVVDIEVASRVSVPPAASSFNVDDLVGVPDASRPLLAELLAAKEYDIVDMRERIARHVARFESAARVNEFLNVREAALLAQGCNALLDSLTDDTPERNRRLICAAVEYVILPADGGSDLEIGGLDDDVAVFNAVLRALGRDHLALTL